MNPQQYRHNVTFCNMIHTLAYALPSDQFHLAQIDKLRIQTMDPVEEEFLDPFGIGKPVWPLSSNTALIPTSSPVGAAVVHIGPPHIRI